MDNSDAPRSVAVGRLVRRLHDLRPQRRSWLPKLALAICTVACGMMVKTTLQIAQMGMTPSFAQVSQISRDSASLRNLPSTGEQMRVEQALLVSGTGQRSAADAVAGEPELATDSDSESATAHVAFYAPSELGDVDLLSALNQLDSVQPPDQVEAVGESSGEPPVMEPTADLVSTVESFSEHLSSSVEAENETGETAEEVIPVEVADAAVALDATVQEVQWGQHAGVQAARRVYTSLAELSAATWDNKSEFGRQRLREIYRDAALLELTSSAAASWATWQDRSTNGIVVAGEVLGIEQDGDDFVASVLTGDKKASVLNVRLDHLPYRPGDDEVVLFFGQIVDSTVTQPVQISGELVVR